MTTLCSSACRGEHGLARSRIHLFPRPLSQVGYQSEQTSNTCYVLYARLRQGAARKWQCRIRRGCQRQRSLVDRVHDSYTGVCTSFQLRSGCQARQMQLLNISYIFWATLGDRRMMHQPQRQRKHACGSQSRLMKLPRQRLASASK